MAGIGVIVPNPKTSGNGRYTYLAAWGSVIAKGGNEAQARDFVAKLLANVPVLDGGGRGATNTFTQRDIGDVLVAFENENENEAELMENEFGKGKYEVVYPSIMIEAEAPVAHHVCCSSPDCVPAWPPIGRPGFSSSTAMHAVSCSATSASPSCSAGPTAFTARWIGPPCLPPPIRR